MPYHISELRNIQRVEDYHLHSTSIFHEIICSGFTESTSLSFTSSNSTFTNCLRQHNTPYSFHSYQHFQALSNANTCTGTQRCFDGKTFKQTSDPLHNIEKGPLVLNAQNYPSITSFVFISCEWNGCSVNSGGAISTSLHSIELDIEACRFLSCVASIFGGAIYAQSSTSVSINNSLFHSCRSQSNNISHGGGGLFLISIKDKIHVASSTFYSCTSKCDGGAADIQEFFPSENKCYEFYACTFLKCVISYDYACEGGALLLWNISLLQSSNTLFSRNEGWAGGACGTNCVSCAPNYQMYFCLFHMNKALKGNDVYFYVEPSHSPLLHCFSTTEDKRICYFNGDYHFNKDNWLPFGTLSFIIVCNGDSHGHTIYPNQHLHSGFFINNFLHRHLLRYSLFRSHRENTTLFHFL